MIFKRRGDNCYSRYDNYQHIYCSNCGKSSYFKQDHKCICNNCGHIIYPSERCKFKDKVEMLKRKKEKEI